MSSKTPVFRNKAEEDAWVAFVSAAMSRGVLLPAAVSQADTMLDEFRDRRTR